MNVYCSIYPKRDFGAVSENSYRKPPCGKNIKTLNHETSNRKQTANLDNKVHKTKQQ